MKTRIGKIARLPKPVRDELNHRLENGADGPELLAWLNALPEVQRVIAEKFAGRPLTKQNLSDWRRGGYADWADTRAGKAQWQDLIERGMSLEQKGTGSNGTDISGRLATFLLVELAEAIDELHKMKDSKQRWKVLQMISRALARLQNEHSRDKRIRLWEAREAKCLVENLRSQIPALEGRQRIAQGQAAQQPQPGETVPIKPIFSSFAPAKGER